MLLMGDATQVAQSTIQTISITKDDNVLFGDRPMRFLVEISVIGNPAPQGKSYPFVGTQTPLFRCFISDAYGAVMFGIMGQPTFFEPPFLRSGCSKSLHSFVPANMVFLEFAWRVRVLSFFESTRIIEAMETVAACRVADLAER